MALFRKLFFRKPPDGLLEICEKVFVFDCCFATDSSEKEGYNVYIRRIVAQFHEQFTDASILVFNFRGGDGQSELSSILSELDVTIMDYPQQYEGCPLLTMEVIHHFLRSCESWLSLGHSNLLLMHCERGGWPVLAFMLAALLLYMKLYQGELRTLDMVYKQAPRELLQFLSPLNPVPSQFRYLQYVSRRNVGTQWPPLDRALTLDCIIIRLIPNFDKEGGCRPLFRIYGQDPFLVNDRTPKRLFSTPKRSKSIRACKQVECELVKIDINCHIQGDIVVECLHLCEDMEREEMMFRVMFNTAFIRSNILMLNRDEIDMLWDAKDLFPKEFRVEVLFSEMDAAASIVPTDFSCFEEKEGLPVEAFARVQEMFNHIDWLDPVTDAALHMLQKINASNITPEDLNMKCRHGLEGCCSPKTIPKYQQKSRHRNRRQSSSSFDEKDLLFPAQKSSPHRIIGAHTSQSMPVFTNPKQDPPALLLENQTSPDSTVKNLLLDHVSCKSNQFTDPPIASSSTVQGPTQPSSAVVPIDAITWPSTLPPPPPPPPLPGHNIVHSAVETPLQTPSPPPLPPPAKFVSLDQGETNCHSQGSSITPSASEPQRCAPPPPPPLSPTHLAISSTLKGPLNPPPLTPSQPQSPLSSLTPPPPPTPPLRENPLFRTVPPQPPSPTLHSGQFAGPKLSPPVPPQAPPFPNFSAKRISNAENSLDIPSAPPPPPLTNNSFGVPSIPPPPTHNSSGLPSAPPPPALPGKGGLKPGSPSPPPPLTSLGNAKGRGLARPISSKSGSNKKLKPLHWLKLSRAVQGSLWAEAQKSGEATEAPEIDMLELESLFSASVPTSDSSRKPGQRSSNASKPDKVQLIDHRRAYNCEIMLSKVKVPLHELMGSVLALEDSALDIDQVENLIKFCPTKEEMELLKGYGGEKDKLGRCEQFFLELMQVPRVESKLRVFSFKMQFCSQVSDLRNSLNVVNSAVEEIRDSVKLKRIMQTILSLGNALNQGTARGSAVGFRLDSLLKLTETRARNNRMTLMHYLCKVLAIKLPEVLDFSKDLANLEPASKIQLKFLAEEMQAISKGLEKVVQELALAENDGPVSENFCQILKEFLHFAEAEVRSLASLYSGVGRNVDALILYFGEDPARCPFEQAVSTLMNFQRMFNKAHEENCKHIELEMKKASENNKSKMGASHKEADHLVQAPIHGSNVH